MTTLPPIPPMTADESARCMDLRLAYVARLYAATAYMQHTDTACITGRALRCRCGLNDLLKQLRPA